MFKTKTIIKFIAKMTISLALVGWVYGFFAVVPQTEPEVAQAADLSTLRPNADHTASLVTSTGGNYFPW
jgi:hypothetical protein